MVWFDDYVKSIESFASGKIDGNSMTLNDTIMVAAGGKKLSVVLTNDNSHGNDQIIAKHEIKKIEDLKGKKIAAEAGTVDHFLLVVALAKAGMSEKDIRFENMLTDKAAEAFAKGNLDAVGVFAPFTVKALRTNKGKALVTSADFPGLIPDHLVLDKKWVKKHPKKVSKIVKTWFETLKYIEDNRAEALAIMAKRADVSVKEYKELEAGTKIFSVDQNVKAFDKSYKGPTSLYNSGKQIVKHLKSGKFITRRVNVKTILDGSFVTKYATGKAH